MKKQISAQIVADSINPQGDRITTFLLTYPRFIHGELMTHRMFSRNSASSRAIPFEKMVKMVEEDPFIPIAWQKDHKGMQGTEYWSKEESDKMDLEWLQARNKAIYQARMLHYAGVTKQICNRLLEPFMWHTVLLTGTNFRNFFELRCPQYEYKTEIFKSKKDCINSYTHGLGKGFEKDRNYLNSLSDLDWLLINKSQAEIHIQALAEAMWDAMNESTPKQLESGQWHIPFNDKIDYALHKWNFLPNITELWGKDMSEYGIKVATARCARLSYMTFDGEINYEKDVKLHDQLLESKHYSPFEHCARAMNDDEYYEFAKGRVLVKDGYGDGDSLEHDINNNTPGWCDNFRGFISYRYLTQNKSIV